jgi:hypothetical protein
MAKDKSLDKDIKRILETPFWLSSLESDRQYSRIHDDCDGDPFQQLTVGILQNGDVFITSNFRDCLRFRTWGGGGMSLRVRNALLILAEAIRLDNLEKPQDDLYKQVGKGK